VKLAELSDNKNVTFLGNKTYSDPSYIFSWGQDPQLPMIYAPAEDVEILVSHYGTRALDVLSKTTFTYL